MAAPRRTAARRSARLSADPGPSLRASPGTSTGTGPAHETTFTDFIIGEQRKFPHATGELTALINDVRLACKRIAHLVGKGAIAGTLGKAGTRNVQGEEQATLDILANEVFLRAIEYGGSVAAMASEELEGPYHLPAGAVRGRYLLSFDPLDGSSNIDVNVAVGSIFSVVACPDGVVDPDEAAFLQPGVRQVCAGYAIYGPSTMLVLTLGSGVFGFTLDRELGEFILTHPNLSVPRQAGEFAINVSNSRFWEPAVVRYVDECLAGRSGPRAKDFNMRWVASLVAETHRILMRGGVFLYPRDTRQQGRHGKLRLLYEANPIGLLIEQAGGRASTGYGPILDVQPERLHQRTGFVFGASAEVERIEQYHRDHNEQRFDAPLFGSRGLFRDSA